VNGEEVMARLIAELDESWILSSTPHTVKGFLFGRYVEGDLARSAYHIGKDNPESARGQIVRSVEAFRLLASRPEPGARESSRIEWQMWGRLQPARDFSPAGEARMRPRQAGWSPPQA